MQGDDAPPLRKIDATGNQRCWTLSPCQNVTSHFTAHHVHNTLTI